MTRHRVLFVCTGNICRSPTAEGVARVVAQREGVSELFQFDSAGTHGYHVGEAPDPRTVAAAAKRGYDLSPLRARRVTDFDFVLHSHILAMDYGHLDLLRRACPAEHRGKLGMFLHYAKGVDEEDVPDPYYGGEAGFDHVLDLVENAALGLIQKLASK